MAGAGAVGLVLGWVVAMNLAGAVRRFHSSAALLGALGWNLLLVGAILYLLHAVSGEAATAVTGMAVGIALAFLTAAAMARLSNRRQLMR